MQCTMQRTKQMIEKERMLLAELYLGIEAYRARVSENIVGSYLQCIATSKRI